MTSRGVIGLLVAVVVGAAIAAGLVMMGSPSEARSRRLDARRVADLAQIARNVDVFWSRRAHLPVSLDELGTELGLNLLPSDPDTGAPYEFTPLEENRYELCATFAGQSEGEPLRREDRFWVHGPGLVCFELSAETAEREPQRPGGAAGSGTEA